MSKVFKVGLIGCGHIAETYFRAHKYFKNFKIIKCADVKEKAAKKCAKIYKIKAVSVSNLLKDKQIELTSSDFAPILSACFAKFTFTKFETFELSNKQLNSFPPLNN